MRVVILGKGEMLANLIEGTLLSGAEIIGVLRYERVFNSKLKLLINDFIQSNPVLTIINTNHLKDLNFSSANSEAFRNFLIKNNVDVVLVGTWPEKIIKEIFNTPKYGTINVHPSLLPKYRGPNPYLQTIWKGESHSGLTFHLMNEEFDSGSILAQAKIKIYKEDTGKELRTKTATAAKFLCMELLKDLDSGCVIPTPQDEGNATYFPEVKPEDMTLDFSKETSSEILRHVRAFHPFRPTYIDDGNQFWIVNPYKVKVIDKKGRVNSIIEKGKTHMIICAKDNVALEFNGLKKYSRIFT